MALALPERDDVEMQGSRALDRVFGTPGWTRAVLIADQTDDGLERLRRHHARRIEDADDGLRPFPPVEPVKGRRKKRGEMGPVDPDGSRRATERALAAVVAEQDRRQVLRELWCAREGGTDSYDRYYQAGGLEALHGQGPQAGHGVPPSYRLATLLDLRSWRLDGVSVFDWGAAGYPRCTTAEE